MGFNDFPVDSAAGQHIIEWWWRENCITCVFFKIEIHFNSSSAYSVIIIISNLNVIFSIIHMDVWRVYKRTTPWTPWLIDFRIYRIEIWLHVRRHVNLSFLYNNDKNIYRDDYYSQIIIQKIYNGRVELWWGNESLILWKRYDKIRDRHPFHRTARGQSFLSNASSNIWQQRRRHKQIVFLYYVYTTNDLMQFDFLFQMYPICRYYWWSDRYILIGCVIYILDQIRHTLLYIFKIIQLVYV